MAPEAGLNRRQTKMTAIDKREPSQAQRVAKPGGAALIPEMLHAGFYKRSQGRITRQVTFGAMAVGVLFGSWSLYGFLRNQMGLAAAFGTAAAVAAVGCWIAFRVVNLPRFADFLISVEAEMNKVSWPTRSELFRSSVVVIVTIFGLAIVLFAYDLIWQFVLGPSFLKVIGG
jgi:preprotein translocase subunit SecE